jgi:hypothetical protein
VSRAVRSIASGPSGTRGSGWLRGGPWPGSIIWRLTAHPTASSAPKRRPPSSTLRVCAAAWRRFSCSRTHARAKDSCANRRDSCAEARRWCASHGDSSSGTSNSCAHRTDSLAHSLDGRARRQDAHPKSDRLAPTWSKYAGECKRLAPRIQRMRGLNRSDSCRGSGMTDPSRGVTQTARRPTFSARRRRAGRSMGRPNDLTGPGAAAQPIRNASSAGS